MTTRVTMPPHACPDPGQDVLDEDPWCLTLPGQRRLWSASSLKLLMTCPRKFQLMDVEGWVPVGHNIHTEFGRLYHAAAEMYDTLRLSGRSQEDATWEVMSHYARNTVGCLGTDYLPVWRCTSPATIIGPRSGRPTRNTKRCPCAKLDQFEGGHRGGEPCPECGLPTFDDWATVSPDRNKNRDTLLRTILHYCDTTDDRVLPYKFPDDTYAVELPFSLDLPLISPDGTPYVLRGQIDGMVEFAGEVVPRERKTTKNTLGEYFFSRFEPDVQIDTYDLVTWALYSDVLDPKPHGVLLEATQVTPNFTKIDRQIINVSEERRAEWLEELQWWIKQAEGFARAKKWPMNKAACNSGLGCPMRSICAKSPSLRAGFLPGERFVKKEGR